MRRVLRDNSDWIELIWPDVCGSLLLRALSVKSLVFSILTYFYDSSKQVRNEFFIGKGRVDFGMNHRKGEKE